MTHSHDIALVPLSGDLSVQSAPMLKRTLEGLFSNGACRIVLNMAEVPYVDSAGMSVILGAVRRMRHEGGLLSLVNVSPDVLRALRIARLVDLIPVSAAGDEREVPPLDPSTLPLWRTTLPVHADDLQSARMRVEELVSTLPFSRDAVFDTTLAVGEAVGNAADHTCGQGILVTMTAYPDRLLVEVADCGNGFLPAETPAPPNDFDERGRGIRLMQLLVDLVTIEPKSSGSGTVVRLVKLV